MFNSNSFGGMRHDREIARITHKNTAIRILKNTDETKQLQLWTATANRWNDISFSEAQKVALQPGRGNKFTGFLLRNFPEMTRTPAQTEKPAEKPQKRQERARWHVASDGVRVYDEVMSGDFRQHLRFVYGRKLQFKFGFADWQILTPIQAREYFYNNPKFSAFLDKHFPQK